MSFDELSQALAAIAVQESAAPLISCTEHTVRGTDLEVTVPADVIAAAGRILDQALFALEAITGIDWLERGQMEVVYDFTHFTSGSRVVVRTFLQREQAELPSLATIYPCAEWHERETHDFFGILFSGHPDLTPLLLPEDADFHPLRKDFTG
ncbi:MAG: NADH-quinone oxidoreductase subunit C [Deltaproteobacteria bacterium]|nr:NADH-quinone oxidoreductase subunit C [Deltaproteobacteria bacterium]TLN01567.1 MAG: NADH-quinone oxidoreductase subunit C [bacterium]